MAGRPKRRIQDGNEARRLLSRVLLGIDGSPVRLWSDEPLMGCLYQRLCPAGEDHLGEPIVQSTWRACVHCLGSMDCFWLAKLNPVIHSWELPSATEFLNFRRRFIERRHA